MDEELRGKWMPRKQTTCARKSGHAPPCMTAANMASRRAYRRAHPHLESPESRRKSNRKYRISSYGLTQDDFNLLLKTQGYTSGMCHEPFAEGQLIHVDHDHGCCRVKNRSCGKCVRGLLCHGCNIALGHIEHRYAMARAYLDGPLSLERSSMLQAGPVMTRLESSRGSRRPPGCGGRRSPGGSRSCPSWRRQVSGGSRGASGSPFCSQCGRI
jgi:hypothetical protein